MVAKAAARQNLSKKMALVIKGRIQEYYSSGVAILPDYSLTEKNDGTIDGNVVFECDIANVANLPQIGAPHPRDSRAECYNREITFLGLRKVRLTASYFGLVSGKTKSIISYSPNTDKNAIETHPDFEAFAGDKDTPKNGAEFDQETGEFFGFFDPSKKGFFGARNYLFPSTMISLTYWQNSVPSLNRRMSIRNSVPGFRKPSDVKDFLLLDIPYRQVGSFYQVTEQYLGSGPDGFNKAFYP